MGKLMEWGIGVPLLLAVAGCGAATVDASAADATARVDAPAADLGALDLGASPADAGATDALAPDALPRDVAPEARVCPVVDDVPAPDVPASDAPYVVELALGSPLHQCARMSDGTVRCKGYNGSGELGLGTAGELNVPSTTVPGLSDVEQVVTSERFATCSRHRDGTVRCWGYNGYGLLGTGHDGDENCRAGSPSALCRTRPTLVPGLTDVVHLAVGFVGSTICASRRDGTAWCWGSGDPRIGAPESATPAPATRVSGASALWWRAFGWVWRLSAGGYGSDTTIPGLSIPPDAEFADGPYSAHLCFRLADGSVRCLGANTEGQVGNGESSRALPGVTAPWDPGLCGVRSVATGSYTTCAVLSDRTVRCWGDGQYGGLGFSPTERCVGISASGECATRPAAVPGLDSVDRLFLGVWGGCALRVDHRVWCWGLLAPTLDGPPGFVEW